MVLQLFVVEDGEVEGEAEFDRVAGRQIDSVGLLVRRLGLLFDFLELGVLGDLCDIAVVVADLLHEEDLGLVAAFRVEDAVVDDLDDLLAVLYQLLLDLRLVAQERRVELGVLGVLLEGADGAACGALGADQSLEGDLEEVALVGVDRAAFLLEHCLHEVEHVLEELRLLGDSREEYFLFNVYDLLAVRTI